MKRLFNRLFALAFPSLFLASVISIFHDRISVLPPAGALFWTVMFCTGIVSSSLSVIFQGERLGGKAKFQALAFTFISAYAIFILLNTGEFPARANPGPEKILMLVCLVVQWVWSGVIAQFFESREIILQSLEGKSDRELRETLKDDGFLLSNVMDDLNRVKSSTITAAVILFLLIAILCAFGLHLTFISLGFIILFYFLVFISCASFVIYQDEQIYAGLGLGSTFSLTTKRFQYALKFLLACAAISLVLSADKAILPPTPFLFLFGLLQRFMAWLSPDGPRTDQLMLKNDMIPMKSLKDVLGDEPTGDWNLTWLYLFFKYTILIAIFAGTLWFLFGSFFKRDFRNFLREGKLWKYLKLFLASVRNLARGAIAWIGSLGSGGVRVKITPTHSRASYEKSIRERLHPGKSREKKIEIGKLTEQFMRIVDWGDARGIAYNPAWAPFEYATVLSREFQAAAGDLARASTLFEKALYSTSLLDKMERDLFARSVGAVLAIQDEPVQ